jgi:hypothetical protein
MVLGAFRAGLREIFTLETARARVASYGPRLGRIREEKREARTRLATARRLANPFVALELMTAATEHLRRAQELSEVDGPSIALPARVPTSFAEAEGVRDVLEVDLAQALKRIESRSPTELAGLRVGRFAAVLVALLAIVVTVIHRTGVHDVALHKPVRASSVRDGKPEAVTDGRTRGTFAIQTNDGPHPFVMVDLERTYRLQRVRVFNRGDGWFDEILPLSIEASTDGITFKQIARRTDHFDVWTVELGWVDARWVRLTKENGYIAINELEVYARE